MDALNYSIFSYNKTSLRDYMNHICIMFIRDSFTLAQPGYIGCQVTYVDSCNLFSF